MKTGVSYIVLMVTLLVCNVHAYKKVGMITYFSIDGLNELLGKVVHDGIRSFMKNYTIPDIDGESKLLVGRVKWHFKGIHIAALSLPVVNISKETKNSGVVSGQDFTFTINGKYQIKMWPFSDSGSFAGTLCTNVRVRGTIDIKSVMHWSDCVLDVKCGIAINLKDNNFDIPDIVQYEINSKAKSIISSKLSDTICECLPTIDFNDPLYALPINNIFALDASIRTGMAMPNDPGIASFYSAGSVFPRYENYTLIDKNIPFPSPDFTDIKSYTHKQFGLIMKNYTINTFVYTAVRLGCLNRDLLSQLLPLNQRIYFAVDCIKVCIGKYFPIFSKRYPGRYFDVNITFTNDIGSRLDDQGIYVYNTVILDFYIGNASLLALSMDTETVGVPYVATNTIVIKGTLKSLKVKNIHLISSTVGHVPFSVLQWMSDKVTEVELVPRIKALLEKGIDVSNFSRTRIFNGRNLLVYQDVDIYLHNDTIRLSGNIVFRPKETDID